MNDWSGEYGVLSGLRLRSEHPLLWVETGCLGHFHRSPRSCAGQRHLRAWAWAGNRLSSEPQGCCKLKQDKADVRAPGCERHLGARLHACQVPGVQCYHSHLQGRH